MWIHWILHDRILVWVRKKKKKCDKNRHFITLPLQVVPRKFTYYICRWVRPNIYCIDEACVTTLLHEHRHSNIRQEPVASCCQTLSRNTDEG